MFHQLYNNRIQKTQSIIEPSGCLFTVYEVLRVVEGIPLFFEDHYQRLLNSVTLVGKAIELDEYHFFSQLIQLCQLDGVHTGNLMLKVYFFENEYNISGYFIPPVYPNKELYKTGAELGLLKAERMNPGAKVENQLVRNRANQQIQQTGVYEVLLVDHNDEITEGSRSNFLAIKDNCIFTAPLSKVLHGITMLKTIQIADEKGIPVYFESIKVQSLDKFDALFITGTSPKILPISKLGELTFDVDHPVLKMLMQEYQKLIVLDIAKKRDSFQNPH